MPKIQLVTKSQSYELLKANFLKKINCILYLQDHRTQLWYYFVNIIKIILTLKLNQSLKKIICR